MFRDSVHYALANQDEVFGAVGKANNLPPAFFKWWFAKSSDVPGTFTEEHGKIINKFFELSKEIGMIKDYPDINSQVWERALRA
jgi:NitT/TauT family transport system substrate-binding protein